MPTSGQRSRIRGASEAQPLAPALRQGRFCALASNEHRPLPYSKAAVLEWFRITFSVTFRYVFQMFRAAPRDTNMKAANSFVTGLRNASKTLPRNPGWHPSGTFPETIPGEHFAAVSDGRRDTVSPPYRHPILEPRESRFGSGVTTVPVPLRKATENAP